MKPFDERGAFRSTAEGVKHQAVRGAAATLAGSGLGLTIQVISTIVLARLLSPADYGLVTMVTTFSLLLSNFGFNGLTEAVIQREDLDRALASNLFWINVSGGLLLSVGFAAAGTLLARVYGNPNVRNAVIGIAPTIFLSSTWVLHIALLKRAMRFSAVTLNEICGRAISVAVSILLGWAGWGYWALIGGAIALPVSISIGAWSMCRWLPDFPRRAKGTGTMVRFAMNVYGRFTVNYGSRNLDNFLVGWRFDAVSLGFYKRAYDLFALSAVQLVAPLTSVAVSALSRMRGNSAEYKRYFLSALGVIAFMGMGVGATLTLIGPDIIRLLLGPHWAPAGRIFMYFGPGVGIMLLYGTHGWLHLSLGRADRWLRWGIVEFLVTGSLFVFALRWGPVGIAISWTVSFWILTFPAFWYAGKPIGFTLGPVFSVVWKYVVAALLAGGAVALIRTMLPFYPLPKGSFEGSFESFVRIVISSTLFALSYLGAVILLHGGAAPLYQLASLARAGVPRGRSSKSAPLHTQAAADTSKVLP